MSRKPLTFYRVTLWNSSGCHLGSWDGATGDSVAAVIKQWFEYGLILDDGDRLVISEHEL